MVDIRLEMLQERNHHGRTKLIVPKRGCDKGSCVRYFIYISLVSLFGILVLDATEFISLGIVENVIGMKVMATNDYNVLVALANSSKTEVEQVETECNSTQIEKDTIQFDKDDFKAQLQNLTEEKERIQSEKDELETQVTSLTKERDSLLERLNGVKEHLDGLPETANDPKKNADGGGNRWE